MSDPVQHHFVPKVYLESFADRRGQVWCYDSNTEKIYSRAPKELAVKKDYNSSTSPDGTIDRNTIENFFGDFEAQFPQILRELTDQALKFENQRQLVLFAALQIIRSPMTRDILSRIATSFPISGINDALAFGLTLEEHEVLRLAKTGDRRANDEVSLRISGHTFRAITMILERLNFSAIHFEDSAMLLTSDNPVFLSGIAPSSKGKWLLAPNLPENRIFLVYPVSPRILLFGDSKKSNISGIFDFQHYTISRSRNIQTACNNIQIQFHRRNLFGASRTEIENAVDRGAASRDKAQTVATNLKKIVSAIHSQRRLVS